LATLAALTPDDQHEAEAPDDDADRLTTALTTESDKVASEEEMVQALHPSVHPEDAPDDEALTAQRCFDSVFVQGLKDSNGEDFRSKVNTWRMLAEDRLSVDCSFVLCDTTKIGLPLAFVSRGFAELTEYSPNECIGKKCGTVLCRKSMAADISKATGLAEEEVDMRVALMTRFAVAACSRALASGPTKKHCFTLLLNQKKSGALFVCEFSLYVCRHPQLLRDYIVGYQHDATSEISIGALLGAATDDASFANFLQTREPPTMWSSTIGNATVQYLHSKMQEVWCMEARTLLQKLQGHPSQTAPEECSTKEDDESISFKLTESKASGLPRTNDHATQTEESGAHVAMAGPVGAALHRQRTASAPPRVPRERLNTQGLPHPQGQFDGSWAAILNDPKIVVEPWLRFLRIHGDHVVDGTQTVLRLEKGADGRMFLYQGALSIENGVLTRVGRSGIRLNFARAPSPAVRLAAPRTRSIAR